MVTVSGPGKVIFDVAPTKNVAFSSLPTSGGTKFFVGMAAVDQPTLLFRRSTFVSDPADNVDVFIGPRSLLSYIAATPISSGAANEKGFIVFDPSNSGSGSTDLTIQDLGAFIVYGHLLTATGGLNNPNFLLTDIDLSTPAGLQAGFSLANASGVNTPAPLQIINQNKHLGPYLSDPFCEDNFNGALQSGFILGPNSTLSLGASTYLDYIGTATNTVPIVNTPFDNLQEWVQDVIICMKICSAQALIKERNPSAFIVDGFNDPSALPATINLTSQSAIYFRSGVSCNGDVTPTFTVDPDTLTDGAGNIIFDIEAPLEIVGDSQDNTGLSVLSIQVTPTGCPITVEATPQNPIFPEPTFARDDEGNYLGYNRACWFVNARVNVHKTSIIHTDYLHHVYERNNLGFPNINSEPTYIGGESFKLCMPDTQPRPTIALYNSMLRVQKNIGSTGVDWRIPNDPFDLTGNYSTFRFYYNGRAIDNAYGRVMVLGTNYGSLSACGQLIDNNSHLDVFQDVVENAPHTLVLSLDVNANTSCIVEGINTDITGQDDVHSIFLNNASNISIGGNVPDNELISTPSLLINGDFFAFETAGGLWAYPEASGTTGQGGMFVDRNGTVSITDLRRASFGMMVTRIGNGIIDLPRDQVYFESKVGTTKWNIDLRIPADRILIPQGVYLSDFTMDWGAVTKDYTSTNSFVPYEPKMTPLPCQCPPVTDANLRSLPNVQGMVDQFQIKRSRIGDQMHLQVEQGGYIRELVFLPGRNAGEAPVGFLVVQDDAFVGLGTAHRNNDSLYASIKLGINGVTLCPNGNGTIQLNENILIDNVCHIVSGTSFGVNGPQTLTIHAETDKEFRIKSTGILDLMQFDTPNKILQFAGNVQVVCEPGAQIMLGGGSIVFTDNATFTLQRVLDTALLAGTQPKDLDDIRVKMFGSGTILMNEDAQMYVLSDQFFGIETDPQCANITTFTWVLNDSAGIHIGTADQPGGAFQIGNTKCIANNSVSVDFIIDGPNALFEINSEGFLGFGVGMADKSSQIPNEWLVNCLSNAHSISVEVRQGNFVHNRIFTGDDSNASLFAIGPVDALSSNFSLLPTRILGGGNFALLTNCTDGVCNETLDNRTTELDNNTSPDVRMMIERAQEMINQAMKIDGRGTAAESNNAFTAAQRCTYFTLECLRERRQHAQECGRKNYS